jgi:anti-sigma B factor antagonist
VAEVPSVETASIGHGLVARVSGEMDYLTSPTVWEQLKGSIVGSDRFVVLDLSGVSFCDSAGLNVLLRAGQQADRSGAELVLACVPPQLRRTLEMTGADQVLHIYDTVAEARTVLGD